MTLRVRVLVRGWLPLLPVLLLLRPRRRGLKRLGCGDESDRASLARTPSECAASFPTVKAAKARHFSGWLRTAPYTGRGRSAAFARLLSAASAESTALVVASSSRAFRRRSSSSASLISQARRVCHECQVGEAGRLWREEDA